MTVTPIAPAAPAPQSTGSRKTSSGGDFARHLDSASYEGVSVGDIKRHETAEATETSADAPTSDVEGSDLGRDGVPGREPEPVAPTAAEVTAPAPDIVTVGAPAHQDTEGTHEGVAVADAEATPTVTTPTVTSAAGAATAEAGTPQEDTPRTVASPDTNGGGSRAVSVDATLAAQPTTASATPAVPAPAPAAVTSPASTRVATVDEAATTVPPTTSALAAETAEVELPVAVTPSPRAAAPQDSTVAVLAAAPTQGAAPSGPVAAPAAPAQAVPLPHQLAPHLAQLRTLPEGEHVLTVSVDPEHFGPVKVVAHITPDGATVQLVSPTDTGREALRGALADLRRDLAATGLQAQLDLGTGSGPGQRDGTPGRDAPTMPGSVPRIAHALHGDMSTLPSTVGASGAAGLDLIL